MTVFYISSAGFPSELVCPFNDDDNFEFEDDDVEKVTYRRHVDPGYSGFLSVHDDDGNVATFLGSDIDTLIDRLQQIKKQARL